MRKRLLTKPLIPTLLDRVVGLPTWLLPCLGAAGALVMFALAWKLAS